MVLLPLLIPAHNPGYAERFTRYPTVPYARIALAVNGAFVIEKLSVVPPEESSQSAAVIKTKFFILYHRHSPLVKVTPPVRVGVNEPDEISAIE